MKRDLHKFALILVLLICIIFFPACGQNVDSNIEQISETDDIVEQKIELIAPKEIELGVGATYSFEGEVVLISTLEAIISYSSALPEIATVNNEGLVTAFSEGETEITVFAKTDTNELLDLAKTKVKVSGVPSEFWLEANEIALQTGSTVEFSFRLLPGNLKGKYTHYWISEDEEVVTVTDDGVLHAEGTGKAYIHAYLDGKPEITSECLVYVVPANGDDSVFFIKPNPLPTDQEADAQQDLNNEVLQRELLVLVNTERRKAGLPEFSWSESLEVSSVVRAIEISSVFDHTRPDGSTCFTVNSLCRAENIAAGHRSSEDVFSTWMNSSGHRANMMNPDYTIMGAGFAYTGSDYRYYWVQLFG